MKNTTFNSKIIALALLVVTAGGIGLYPAWQNAGAIPTNPAPAGEHRIEVVFILDTTSSMSGLIQAAKDKIWSIANSMASAQQNPDIRMGLVAFRDRGDAYVTQVFDLSSDLDAMYAQLMDFRAEGGGDAPESVNQALHDAIHQIGWSQDDSVYKVAFLVGDAPPHMDYQDDIKYPLTLAMAADKGIVVNTIQSGRHQLTRPAWQKIAALGKGEYFQVEDSGNAIAIATPFDAELSSLSAELEDTRLYFGDAEMKKEQAAKLDAGKKLREELSEEALARRATFNASASGRKNFLGQSELVDAITSGRVDLDDIEPEELPTSLQALEPVQQMNVITEKARKRKDLQQRIRELSESRDRYLEAEVEAAGGAADSLDEKIYRAVRDQAASVGLTYDDENAKY